MAIALAKPEVGSTNWGSDVNDNWRLLEAALNGTQFPSSYVTICPNKVAIGLTGAGYDLDIQQSNDSQYSGGVRLRSYGGGDNGAVFIQGSDHNTYFFNMGGGSTGNGMGFYVNGSVAAMLIDSSGHVTIGTLGGPGSVNADANGKLSVSSDSRLKTIESNFSKGLSAIAMLTPINFTWKPESGLYVDRPVPGFSAQNVREAIPEAVGVDRRGNLTLDDRGILAACVNAIKELKEMIKSTANLNSISPL